MSTQFDSFDRSGFGAFVRSPLLARNKGLRVIPIDADVDSSAWTSMDGRMLLRGSGSSPGAYDEDMQRYIHPITGSMSPSDPGTSATSVGRVQTFVWDISKDEPPVDTQSHFVNDVHAAYYYNDGSATFTNPTLTPLDNTYFGTKWVLPYDSEDDVLTFIATGLWIPEGSRYYGVPT